ncbi:riboflavin synthase alpha chain [Tepidamorphus gemmatus]|uniref:Riboflavin synthase n=1 Tax=Tepidamorphus gemmatus TaxID=747076 RepID=A0A4R3MD63_9HYPH|nr:riboflavin synthase alpha chain [Tepidamorphus gemmatus]
MRGWGEAVFTGLISDIGEVVSVTPGSAGTRAVIACRYPLESIAIGASIACGGPCLTVVAVHPLEDGRTAMSFDVSRETLQRTTLGAWQPGTRVNLERSLRQGDELGGHMVTGHVDGVAEIVTRHNHGDCAAFALEAPEPLHRFIAEKGSVALDGTSLTVNRVHGRRFEVMLIPHSLAATTWGERRAGDRVNLEVDLMARYVARLKETEPQ